jgi:hypothetical protein
MNKTEEGLWDYLKKHSDFVRGIRTLPPKFKYCCIEDFVLKNGKLFEISKIRPKYGEERFCFFNSYQLMIKEGYTYVEGFAMGVIPVNHAWCLDADGRVIDPTWRPSLTRKFQGIAYIGVALDRSFVIETALQRKSYGVLDDWEGGFPLLTGAEGWRIREEKALKPQT